MLSDDVLKVADAYDFQTADVNSRLPVRDQLWPAELSPIWLTRTHAYRAYAVMIERHLVNIECIVSSLATLHKAVDDTARRILERRLEGIWAVWQLITTGQTYIQTENIVHGTIPDQAAIVVDSAPTVRLRLGNNGEVRVTAVVDAVFQSFNSRATPTYDRTFNDTAELDQLRVATTTAHHAIYRQVPFWAYAYAHGRSLPTVSPRQAFAIHARLTALQAPTPIRRLRVDSAIALLRAPMKATPSYALFPPPTQALLQAAEQALNEPAVCLRMQTGVLTLADKNGRRIHRFINFPTGVIAVVAGLALSVSTARLAGWSSTSADKRAERTTAACFDASVEFFKASRLRETVDAAAVLQWAANFQPQTAVAPGPAVKHETADT